MNIQYGVDRFLAEERFDRNTRFALVTNSGACNASYTPSRLALMAGGCRIIKLFSPEHGLEAVGQDGAPMADGIDPLTGLPVRSLYGERLEPEKNDLSEVDVMLLDLPDVGCRCYTYLWTMTHVMEVCQRSGKPLVVLDRPNPISGILSLAEGPGLDEKNYSSFIGRWDIPLRHSCTYGELAFLWKSSRLKHLDLKIVKASGWSRNMFFHDGFSSFVPTSPAIANAEACLLYAGLCLLEATNLSEGRGTPFAFRVTGAPWLNAVAVAERFNRLLLPGVVARPMTFVPESGKYQCESCKGIMLHVTRLRSFRPVRTAAMLIKAIKDFHPGLFEWVPYPTHVNPSGEKHLGKLLGIENAESLFTQSWEDFVPAMDQLLDCAGWPPSIEPYLLYA